MKIPNKINIVGKTYSIKLVEKVDDSKSWGNLTYSANEIRILKSLDYQNKCETLLHEIMHAIFDVAGIKHNEKHIESIGRLLFQVIPQLENKG